MYNLLLEKLNNSSLSNLPVFASDALGAIVDRIWKTKSEDKCDKITKITDFFDIQSIKNSSELFEIAFSYSKTNPEKAELLYKEILKKHPDDSAVLNNLGVIYMNRGDQNLAYEYYLMAAKTDPDNTTAKNNLARTRKNIKDAKEERIESFSKNITPAYLEGMGYNQELEDKLINIKDGKLRKIISRDIQECAISIAAHQNKAGTILCGSILETVLTAVLLDRGIEKHTICKSTKNEREKHVKDMTLNELLDVAGDISLLSKDRLQLSHFIKDYRNAIHPITELKNEIDFSDKNATIAWTILKDILLDILK